MEFSTTMPARDEQVPVASKKGHHPILRPEWKTLWSSRSRPVFLMSLTTPEQTLVEVDQAWSAQRVYTTGAEPRPRRWQ